MRKMSKLFLLLCFVQLVQMQIANADDWVIVPEKRLGTITHETSEQQLIEMFGAKNVKQSTIDIGEGETQQGTVIFPDDPSKTAQIFWWDTKTRKNPSGISIREFHGDITKTPNNYIWKTETGIGIGTSLKTIEKFNGRPFVILGFGWDYGGTVLHSNGGKLSELGVETKKGIENKKLLLRLSPDYKLYDTPAYASVNGDKAFLSNNPAMQILNPHVYEIGFTFPRN